MRTRLRTMIDTAVAGRPSSRVTWSLKMRLPGVQPRSSNKVKYTNTRAYMTGHEPAGRGAGRGRDVAERQVPHEGQLAPAGAGGDGEHDGVAHEHDERVDDHGCGAIAEAGVFDALLDLRLLHAGLLTGSRTGRRERGSIVHAGGGRRVPGAGRRATAPGSPAKSSLALAHPM